MHQLYQYSVLKIIVNVYLRYEFVEVLTFCVICWSIYYLVHRQVIMELFLINGHWRRAHKYIDRFSLSINKLCRDWHQLISRLFQALDYMCMSLWVIGSFVIATKLACIIAATRVFCIDSWFQSLAPGGELDQITACWQQQFIGHSWPLLKAVRTTTGGCPDIIRGSTNASPVLRCCVMLWNLSHHFDQIM